MAVSVLGIASGIDINNIIRELMEVERQPIYRKEAQIERTEQIAELWREVNTRLDTLSRTLSPLQSELTFTAPVPVSSNEEVLRARVSGNPVEGSYRFNVSQLASYHSVATNPPNAGSRISSPDAALGYNGTFYLGTAGYPEGIDNLTFNSTTNDWLRGNFGAGFQAVVDGSAASVYALGVDDLVFNSADEYAGAEEIRVYLDSFVGAEDEDLLAELESYFADKGWSGIDLQNDPLFTISYDDVAEEWVVRDAAGGDFAFLGDHPLGTFNLRGEVLNDSGEVIAINNFDFQIRDSVDETGFITIEDDDSLLEIANKINAMAPETGIIASLVQPNSGDYRLVLESTVEGRAGAIQAYDYSPLDAAGTTAYGSDQVLTALNLLKTDENAAAPSFKLETEAARDAVFTLNGLTMSRSSNTFTDVIAGLEITLAGIGSSNLDITPDIDAAVEEINLFVQAVNEVNSYLRVLQKNEEGPLQGSSDLMRIERQLRTLIHGSVSDTPGSNHVAEPLAYSGAAGSEVSAVATGQYSGTASKIELTYYASTGNWRYNGETFNSGETIDGVTINIGAGATPSNLATLTLNVVPPSEPLAYNSLASIGIMSSDEEGILVIDDAKLRAALADKPLDIYQLFGREAIVDPSGVTRNKPGLAHQMETFTRNMIGRNGVVPSRQDYLQRQITMYQERIEMLERRMEIREQRLVRQFTYMEQYINRIQEQTGLMTTFETLMTQQQE